MRMRNNLIWLAVVVLALVSCVKEEDENIPVLSNRIGYSVNVGFEKGEAKTKSGSGSAERRKVEISQLDKTLGGKNLYLHTISGEWDTEVNGEADTKGVVIDNSGIESKEIGVSAWVYDDSEGYSSSGKIYFSDEEVSSPWETGRYWPKLNNFIRFYAYAPSDAQTGEKIDGVASTVKHMSAWSEGVPSISYTVPVNVLEQSDMLVASSDIKKENFGSPAHLEFGHALTAVQFQVDGLYNFKIFEVKISGVKDSGIYKYEYNTSGNNGDGNSTTTSDYDAGQWDTQSSSAVGEYILDFGQDGFVCDGQTEYIINGDDKVLFLMPQTLPSGAKITVRGYDVYTNEEVNLSASIAGKVWGKGEKVIYRISLTDINVRYILEVEGKTDAAPFYGEILRDYNVLSYKIVHKMGDENPTYEKVTWRTGVQNEYPEVDTDNTSFWVDCISRSTGEGSECDGNLTSEPDFSTNKSENSGTYGVVAIESETGNQKPMPGEYSSHRWLAGYKEGSTTELLKTDKGSIGSAYDLSTKAVSTDGSETLSGCYTANCYIVDAPGYYKLPLVYGNAIEGGIANYKAYKTDVVGIDASAYGYDYNNGNLATAKTTLGVKVLNNFKNYRDEAINDPWITEDTGISTGMTAEVVWQDEPCLVTETRINGKYLHFRVRRDCICEGNAVVAVKDNEGKIMWSWHIWVTEGRNVYDAIGGVASFNPDDVASPGQLREMYNRVVVKVQSSTESQYLTRKFEIMDAHIGHCDGDHKVYNKRSGQIVFHQYDTIDGIEKCVNSKAFSIEQGSETAVDVITADNVVYYQYGRKDPMLPAYGTGSSSVNKTYYLNDRTMVQNGGTSSVVYVSEGPATSIGEAIQNPGVFYISTSNIAFDNKTYFPWLNPTGDAWVDRNSFNLWNTHNNMLPMFAYTSDMNDTPYKFFKNFGALIDLNESGEYIPGVTEGIGMTKTIYDPSPRGYEMPRVDAFTGFTFDGLKRRNELQDNKKMGINVEEGTFANFSSYHAFSFYTIPMPSEDWSFDEDANDKPTTVYIQAVGHRVRTSGTLDMYNDYGAALTSTPICVQWVVDSNEEESFKLQLARFCYINSSKTFRPISSSDLSLAFPVMPIKTGKNPDPDYYMLYSDPATVTY